MSRVVTDPHTWPYDGDVDPAHTALICIDWQTDFCGKGGYVDTMVYDLALTRAPLEPTVRVPAAARRQGMMVIHTPEGHRPDLADLPANKRWRDQAVRYGFADTPAAPRRSPRTAAPSPAAPGET